jgi:uncharacterized protein (TIGR02757 family)
MPLSDAPMPRLKTLEELYARYNDPAWLDPDPLAVVLSYDTPADMEVAGLVCAALALGNAGLIVKAARSILSALGPHPAAALAAMDAAAIKAALGAFRYRFFSADDLAAYLGGIRALRRRSALESLFLACDDPSEPDYAKAASGLVQALRAASEHEWPGNLLPDPAKGSASKRTFLFLRWMVRRDRIDPGPWRRCDPSRLVVPLDTHMASACRRYGFLKRKSLDLAAAREAGAALRLFRPDDPLRYDFCMTRPGIRPELDPDECFACD